MTLINEVNGGYVVELYSNFTNSEIAEIMGVSKGTTDRLVNKYVETKRTVGETRSMSGARGVSDEVYQRARIIANIMGGVIPEHISSDGSNEWDFSGELLDGSANDYVAELIGDCLDETLANELLDDSLDGSAYDFLDELLDDSLDDSLLDDSLDMGLFEEDDLGEDTNESVDDSNTNFGVENLNTVYPIIQGSISKLHDLGVDDIELKVDVNINYADGLNLTFDNLDTMQNTLLNGVDGFQHKVRVSIKYVGDDDVNTNIDRALTQYRSNNIISSGLLLPQEDYDELLITIQ